LFRAEDFRYYDQSETAYHLGERRIAKTDCWRLMAVDLAISLDKRADYSVVIVADVTRTGDLILVHVLRDRIGGTKIVPMLQAMNESYRPSYILVEDVAFQRMVLDQARAEGLAVRGIRPDGDKESRTLPLQVRFEAGQVWFPRQAPWLPILEAELTEFPNSRHDDTVDALAYVAYEAGRRSRQRPEKPEAPVESFEEKMAKAMLAGLR
jgi:predicted phage terminase large subunit-like protein